MSKRGRQYHVDALAAILSQKRRKFSCRVSLLIELHPPDDRRRDLDNSLKILQDMLVHSKVLADDELIDDLHIIRRCVTRCGLVIVTIKELENSHHIRRTVSSSE